MSKTVKRKVSVELQDKPSSKSRLSVFDRLGTKKSKLVSYICPIPFIIVETKVTKKIFLFDISWHNRMFGFITITYNNKITHKPLKFIFYIHSIDSSAFAI